VVLIVLKTYCIAFTDNSKTSGFIRLVSCITMYLLQSVNDLITALKRIGQKQETNWIIVWHHCPERLWQCHSDAWV